MQDPTRWHSDTKYWRPHIYLLSTSFLSTVVELLKTVCQLWRNIWSGDKKLLLLNWWSPPAIWSSDFHSELRINLNYNWSKHHFDLIRIEKYSWVLVGIILTNRFPVARTEDSVVYLRGKNVGLLILCDLVSAVGADERWEER